MASTPRSPYGAQSHDEPHFRRAPAPGSQQNARPSGRASSRSARRRDASSTPAGTRTVPHDDAHRGQQVAQPRQAPSERTTVRLAGGASHHQATSVDSTWSSPGHSASTGIPAYPDSISPERGQRPFGAPREPMPQLRGHRQRTYYGRSRTGRNSVIGQPLGRGSGRGRANLGLSRGGRGSLSFNRRAVAAYNAPIRVRRVATCLATVLLTVITWFSQTTSTGIAPSLETSMLDMPVMALPSIPVSTPKSEWKKGTAPHLYQTDPIWSTKSYGGGTIHDNACGPTALTMVYVYVTGNTDMTPLTMSTWADTHGYAPSGATEWSFMTDGAAAFGLTSTMVNSTRDTITAALKAGKPLIALMNEGDFTANGHFIVLTDIDEYGNVTLNDPFSGYRSSHTWPIGTIVRQSTYSWVFEV